MSPLLRTAPPGREIRVEQSAPAARWFIIRRAIVSVTAKKTKVFAHVRDSDWGMALLMLGIGLVLLQPSMGTLRVGSEGSWSREIPIVTWATVLMSIGAIRVAAIVINGRMQNGLSASIRALAAGFGLMFWATIAYTYFLASDDGFSVGTMIFSFFALTEARCTMRSLDDRAMIREATSRAGVPPDGS